MSSYNFTNMRTDFYGKTKVTVMQVNNLKPNKNINIKEMGNIYKTITYKLHKDNKKAKIMIRALGPTGWMHLKGYDQEISDYEGSFEDNYSNRVFDAAKFEQFAQLQFYIATDIENNKNITTPKKQANKKPIKKLFID